MLGIATLRYQFPYMERRSRRPDPPPLCQETVRAAVAQLTVEEVNELRELSRGLASLDQPVGEDGETALGDLLAAERPEPSEEILGSDRDRRVNEIVRQLPEAEQNVIRLRFGLAGDEPRTLKQTGNELGISAERARELEERGLRRLAASGELNGLREAA